MGQGWLEAAEHLAAGADRARREGDLVASLVLAVKAAECAQVARLLGVKEVASDGST